MNCDQRVGYLCTALNNLNGVEVITGVVESLPRHRYNKKEFGNYTVTMKARSVEDLFIPSLVLDSLSARMSGEWTISTHINYDVQDKMRYHLSSRVGHRFLDGEAFRIANAIVDLSNNKNFLRNWQVENCFMRNEEENVGHVYYISLDREEPISMPRITSTGRFFFEDRTDNTR
jgi:hypothetical protein